ncbi:MAG: iron-containing alcohol dehydrogenase family protein [Merismopedia sp. SIO2A8]|nr:iron-containing alcohol dehydrogenase family protein [Merismopedia sp. SIO2A8]
MSSQSTTQSVPSTALPPILLGPAQVLRGDRVLSQAKPYFQRLGRHPLVVGGDRTLTAVEPFLTPLFDTPFGEMSASYGRDCSETELARLRQRIDKQVDGQVDGQAVDYIIGVGGGKALDTAKLLAYQCQLPIATIPTSGATCAAWTALSNVYSDEGAFLYDVSLVRAPELLILDYELIQTAPTRTLVAGIGDALAKWYEASVSSGHSSQTLVIAAVQQARVLRDILFQKSVEAIKTPGSQVWRDVVDASVLLAGVIGGLGGAQCRTVAAHAVHNGLTHILESHGTLHGEKVAYGILVQLRLEELIQGNQLAATARQQLLAFYSELGLPRTLEELGLEQATLAHLRNAVTVACQDASDIHHLPFEVHPEQVMAAMVSTTAPCGHSAHSAGSHAAANLMISDHPSPSSKSSSSVPFSEES